ncbi:transposase [Streptomyces sp. NPDC058579]|uniref:transposase n=1 Tax=Streptomyces sp. NPDC058579 TaxID=3346548 RepID=UPI003653EB58
MSGLPMRQVVFRFPGRGVGVVVSMEPMPWPEPAPEVARAVRAKNYGRKVPLPVAVRDRLGELFPDAEYTQAFGKTGPADWSPGRLAPVTVFQLAEGLTDRQAADAVRDRLSWMYALGLGLTDTGFDHTVLTRFRDRVLAHARDRAPWLRHICTLGRLFRMHRARPQRLPPLQCDPRRAQCMQTSTYPQEGKEPWASQHPARPAGA